MELMKVKSNEGLLGTPLHARAQRLCRGNAKGKEAAWNICVLRIFTASLKLSKHRCQVFDNLEAKRPRHLLSEASGKDSIAGRTHNLVAMKGQIFSQNLE